MNLISFKFLSMASKNISSIGREVKKLIFERKKKFLILSLFSQPCPYLLFNLLPALLYAGPFLSRDNTWLGKGE